MSPDALGLLVVILAGCVIISVVWGLLIKGTQSADWEAEEHDRALRRELRRHD